jgi:hypothetical protein
VPKHIALYVGRACVWRRQPLTHWLTDWVVSDRIVWCV